MDDEGKPESKSDRATDLKQTLTAGAVAAVALATSAATAVPAQAAAKDKEAEPSEGLVTAEAEMKNADASLAEAKAVAKMVDEHVAAGTEVPGDVLSELQSEASGYATGTSLTKADLEGTPATQFMPTVLQSDEERKAAEDKAAAQVAADANEVEELAAPQKLAAKYVKAAEQQADAAKELVQIMKGTVKVDGPGAKKLAEKCAAAGVLIDICKPTGQPETGLKYDSVVISRTVANTWDEIEDIGGYRPSDPYPDHPSGRAVDIMMPNGGQGKANIALGDEIAAYFQEHADEFGIDYMLWRQQSWQNGDKVGEWEGMGSRGDATSNHMDHIHITVKNGHSGDILQQLIEESGSASA